MHCCTQTVGSGMNTAVQAMFSGDNIYFVKKFRGGLTKWGELYMGSIARQVLTGP